MNYLKPKKGFYLTKDKTLAITKRQKEIFIDLRAEGKSFDTIAKEMKISKPTLIKLEYELKEEITNLEFLKYQAIIEKYKLNKISRIESFSKQLQRINDELDKRDYSNLGFRELIIAKNSLLLELKKELEQVKFATGEYEDYDFNADSEVKYNLD